MSKFDLPRILSHLSYVKYANTHAFFSLLKMLLALDLINSLKFFKKYCHDGYHSRFMDKSYVCSQQFIFHSSICQSFFNLSIVQSNSSLMHFESFSSTTQAIQSCVDIAHKSCVEKLERLHNMTYQEKKLQEKRQVMAMV